MKDQSLFRREVVSKIREGKHPHVFRSNGNTKRSVPSSSYLSLPISTIRPEIAHNEKTLQIHGFRIAHFFSSFFPPTFRLYNLNSLPAN
ncbi:hypothetical protein M3Y95_00969800 [Aphelenchoides besseyi]|nr:hypothetical protein M3Y95_00969800 [Aphelenchoides besseyi]